jgi:hypothetical protein
MLNADWRGEQDKGREALSQAVGRVAYRVGFEALMVPSKADPDGTNLVVFPRQPPGRQPDYLSEWLSTPNKAFGDLKPIDVIERGEADRLWSMICALESGQP